VMVSVAKNFDAPIKVVFPKELLPTDGVLKMTMLGLGDIVVPGIFVALCLRFDRHQYLAKLGYLKDKPLPAALKGLHRGFGFPTPYFNSCMAAYVAGLVTTITVMHTFKAAQPALLYLSPACILSVVVTGLARGEISQVFAYAEEASDKKKDELNKKKKEEDEAAASKTSAHRHSLRSLDAKPVDVPAASGGELADDEQENVRSSEVLDETVNAISETSDNESELAKTSSGDDKKNKKNKKSGKAKANKNAKKDTVRGSDWAPMASVDTFGGRSRASSTATQPLASLTQQGSIMDAGMPASSPIPADKIYIRQSLVPESSPAIGTSSAAAAMEEEEEEESLSIEAILCRRTTDDSFDDYLLDELPVTIHLVAGTNKIGNWPHDEPGNVTNIPIPIRITIEITAMQQQHILWDSSFLGEGVLQTEVSLGHRRLRVQPDVRYALTDGKLVHLGTTTY
ncbi:hypothetical protein LPJ66_011390, partial [Kickxella alabastrina]